MNASRRQLIETKVAEMLTALRRLDASSRVAVNPLDLLPIRPSRIIQEVLRLTLEYPDEIPSTSLHTVIAGVLERPRKRIVISRKFSIEEQRFTAAHEVAHYLLHDHLTLHRDRPTDGSERRSRRCAREWTEQEADYFSAKFLMPTFCLSAEFRMRFHCERIDLASLSEEVAFAFAGSLHGVSAYELRRRGLDSVARELAACNMFASTNFEPLTHRFGTTKTALGIELVDLGLVCDSTKLASVSASLPR